MGCITAAIATRGVLCCRSQSVYVDAFAPDTLPYVLEPDIHVPEIDPPSIAITMDIPDIEALDIGESLSPQILVDMEPDPVPLTDTIEQSEEPSVRIRPLEDLVPEIVKKKRD